MKTIHFPAEKWAEQGPYRWYVVAFVICALVLASYAYVGVKDELAELEAQRKEHISAAQQEHKELAHRKALQDICGGPEATVLDLAHGGYACLDKDGRRTKTIPGLARPDSTSNAAGTRAKGARLSCDFECANSTKSAGLVPAGFLRG